MFTKLVCWARGHEYSRAESCPFTGYTYVNCDKCGQRLHAYVTEEAPILGIQSDTGYIKGYN